MGNCFEGAIGRFVLAVGNVHQGESGWNSSLCVGEKGI